MIDVSAEETSAEVTGIFVNSCFNAKYEFRMNTLTYTVGCYL